MTPVTNAAEDKKLEAAKTRYITTYDNSNDHKAELHADVSTTSWAGNDAAGGAGIGGGTEYYYTASLSDAENLDDYKHFTPGSLTINSGTVTAVGGFKSAGIGGAVGGALTTGQIIINGDPATTVENKTKVTAVGSIYAAGIGEGDSVPNVKNEDFVNPYALIINGGVIDVQGGFTAAAIGTTDEMTTSTQNQNLGLTSGMTIALNGGDITAISGRPKGNTSATAAIGAGEGTNMAPYSISIAEGTIVNASSYSRYAISDCGTDAATVPQTSIDPAIYMYLAYYGRGSALEDTSDKPRDFNLFSIKRTDRGDFMLAVGTPDQVMKSGSQLSIYFGYEESTGNLYLVDQNGKTIMDENAKCSIFYVTKGNTNGVNFAAEGKNDKDETVYMADLGAKYADLVTTLATKLTAKADLSYYFVQPPMKTFEVPPGYTAVAMTLYPPETFGGRYIFHIPKSNKAQMTSDLYAVIEKMTSGESSGELQPSFDSHFQMGTPVIPDSTPAVAPDAVSTQLTDLIVTADGKTLLAAENGQQKFVPGTKSYDIWLPVDVNEFAVTAKWTENNSSISIKDGTKGLVSSTNGVELSTPTVKIGESETKEIWIEKKDANAQKITYKLTVRVKAKYTMDLTNLNKTYDGMPVIPGVASMEVREYSEFTVTPMNADTPKVTTPNASNNTEIYAGNYSGRNLTITLNKNLEVTTSFTGRTYSSYSRRWSDTRVEIKTTFSLTNDNVLVANSTTSNTSFYLTDNQNSTQYYLRAVDGVVGLATSATGDVEIVFWSWNENANSTMTGGTVSYDQAASAAKAEVVNKLNDETEIGKPITSSEIDYGGTVTTTTTLSIAQGGAITSGTFNSQSLTWTHVVTQNGKVQASASLEAITDKSSLLKGETVTYTYYPLTTVNSEKVEGDALAEAPKDAGEYRVKATVNATEFEASGSADFTISKRPITIIGIENWRYYLKTVPNNPENTTIPITPGTGTDETKFYSGQIRLDGVVEHASGEIDAVTPTYTSMYFVNSVVGNLVNDKIAVYATLNEEGVNANYTFAGYPANGDYKPGSPSGNQYVFYVPGQVTYDVDGAMFGYGDMTDNGTADFLWYKYYPVIDDWKDPTKLESYLKFPNDPRIDYHSPNSQSHAEHIYVRTVNKGVEEARYAVDITFGSMIFQYTKTIWNVNTLTYDNLDGEDGEVSVWVDPTVSGFAHKLKLTSGDVLIENRSNREISFKATATINTHCVMITYDKDTMEFDEALMNKQHRIAARMIWGDTNEWKDDEITAANSVNTGKSGVATTPLITIPAATNVGIGASESDVSQAPGYKVVSVRLFGIPTATETVGGITISLTPTT